MKYVPCKVLLPLVLALATVSPFGAHASCWQEASNVHVIDPILLQSIGWQESRGRAAAVGPLLPDGNRALGVMQINTIHLPALKAQGIGRNDLFDPCTSVMVGAWVLRDCIDRFGQSWRAVGCYYAGPHSKSFDKMASYVADVKRHYAGYARDAQRLALLDGSSGAIGTPSLDAPTPNLRISVGKTDADTTQLRTAVALLR
jgi:soluble lytic murein transglycosylase-like protein